jgi:hypothetical protein
MRFACHSYAFSNPFFDVRVDHIFRPPIAGREASYRRRESAASNQACKVFLAVVEALILEVFKSQKLHGKFPHTWRRFGTAARNSAHAPKIKKGDLTVNAKKTMRTLLALAEL